MRYDIRLDAIWRAPLFVAGITQSNAYADLGGDVLRLRFGLLFDETVPRDQVASAALSAWPLYRGLGWRTWFGGRLGLAGSTAGIVELALKEPIRVRLGPAPWPQRIQRISVSLRDPQAFLADLAAPST